MIADQVSRMPGARLGQTNDGVEVNYAYHHACVHHSVKLQNMRWETKEGGKPDLQSENPKKSRASNASQTQEQKTFNLGHQTTLNLRLLGCTLVFHRRGQPQNQGKKKRKRNQNKKMSTWRGEGGGGGEREEGVTNFFKGRRRRRGGGGRGGRQPQCCHSTTGDFVGVLHLMRLQTLASVSRTKPDDNVSMNVNVVAIALHLPDHSAVRMGISCAQLPTCSPHPYAIAALWSTGPVLKWLEVGLSGRLAGGRVPGGPGGGGVE